MVAQSAKQIQLRRAGLGNAVLLHVLHVQNFSFHDFGKGKRYFEVSDPSRRAASRCLE
jgi:hypothetical protein